jgi:hypothetical protein
VLCALPSLHTFDMTVAAPSAAEAEQNAPIPESIRTAIAPRVFTRRARAQYSKAANDLIFSDGSARGSGSGSSNDGVWLSDVRCNC